MSEETNEEMEILNGLVEWVEEVFPNLECEVTKTNGYDNEEGGQLTVSSHNTTQLSCVQFSEHGLLINGDLVHWTRKDIKREFQRLVLNAATRNDPSLMMSNPAFMKAWQLIMTQSVD